MSIEAPVKPPQMSVAGTWKSSSEADLPVGATARIATVRITAKRDHRYKLNVSASGVVKTNAGSKKMFSINAGGTDVIVSTRAGMDRGGWDGLMSVPIRLVGLWQAPADGPVDFNFDVERGDAVGDHDWDLARETHQIIVEDLGHV